MPGMMLVSVTDAPPRPEGSTLTRRPLKMKAGPPRYRRAADRLRRDVAAPESFLRRTAPAGRFGWFRSLGPQEVEQADITDLDRRPHLAPSPTVAVWQADHADCSVTLICPPCRPAQHAQRPCASLPSTSRPPSGPSMATMSPSNGTVLAGLGAQPAVRPQGDPLQRRRRPPRRQDRTSPTSSPRPPSLSPERSRGPSPAAALAPTGSSKR